MKKVFALLTCVILIFSVSVTGFCDEPTVSAPHALLIDAKSGKPLYEKDADAQVYPASTTKIMVAVLALENLSLDDVLTASNSAISELTPGYTNMGLKEGEQLSVRQLLYGLMLYSAGDAANVLGERISGSISEFVNLMNKKASELGMNNTHYVNTHGKHDISHYTTTRDMAILARYAMQKEEFREIVKTDMYMIDPTPQYKEVRYLSNTNHLVSKKRNATYFYPAATGIKTGYTDEAKSCLVASASKNDADYIALIYEAGNENGTAMTFIDAKNLFEYAFSSFSNHTILKKGDLITQAPIRAARKERAVLLTAESDITILTKSGEDVGKITHEDHINKKIKAPVKAGEVLGTSDYYVNGEKVGSVNLVADRDYKFNPFSYVLGGIGRFFISPFFYIPVLLILILFIWIRQYRYNQRRKKRLERQRMYNEKYKY